MYVLIHRIRYDYTVMSYKNTQNISNFRLYVAGARPIENKILRNQSILYIGILVYKKGKCYVTHITNKANNFPPNNNIIICLHENPFYFWCNISIVYKHLEHNGIAGIYWKTGIGKFPENGILKLPGKRITGILETQIFPNFRTILFSNVIM